MKLFYSEPADLTAYPSGKFPATIKSVELVTLVDQKAGKDVEKLKWVLTTEFSEDPFAVGAIPSLDLNYYTGTVYGNVVANLTKIINALASGPVDAKNLPDTDKLVGKKLLVLVRRAEEAGQYPKIADLEPIPKGK